MKLVLLAHLAATLFMTGVIWFVQVVHYPLFARVGGTDYAAYADAHSRLTAWVVAPPMLLELATGALLVLRRPEHVAAAPVFAGFLLIVVIWLSTFLLQVPQHNILGAGFDDAAHRTLVTTNWVRTAAWTLRSLIVVWIVAEAVKV